MRRTVAVAEGRVAAFDARRGLGEIVTPDGMSFPFHCIDIADGSREIDVETPVTFVTRPKFGRLEATEIRSR